MNLFIFIKYDVIIAISVNEKIKIKEINGKLTPFATGDLPSTRISAIASESIEKQGIQMLIGMDIISQGQLTITDGIFIFSIG